MKPFLKVDKLTKSLAGVVAVVATVLALGGPLTLAEYYAETGSDGYVAAGGFASQSVSALPRKS